MKINNTRIAIIGLGYVGLPLAVEFSKKFNVIGYDINQKRVEELISGSDVTLEVSEKDLGNAKKIKFTSDASDLSSANCFIVTVPTPIDSYNRPDLKPLINATKIVAGELKSGDIVIYESTVYPGATEEECVPILEHYSGFSLNKDFFCGYSPERINPGDKEHNLANITKITSGSNDNTANFVDDLYNQIIDAGTFKAKSIKVAEAAKVIENTQRDLNIALMNELAIIFNKMDIDTQNVLEAAGTKWNFLPFRPGLVGGHCIGVDPYYLTHKAQSIGHNPEFILSGRRINDGMGSYVALQLIKKMIHKSILIEGSKILILGLTFKENCPDIRNTRVIDIYKDLLDYNCSVDVYDPWVTKSEAKRNYNISLIETIKSGFYDGVIIAVAHNKFKEYGASKIKKFGKSNCVIYDLKYILDSSDVDLRL